jgi:hypothetical protein
LGPILGLDTGRKKKCWPFVLDVLDDFKCSENFLAPTIIIPIRLNATISIHIVHWLQALQQPWPAARPLPRAAQWGKAQALTFSVLVQANLKIKVGGRNHDGNGK